MAASTAVDDPGTFPQGAGEDRYNPFEGAGAVSRRRIELPFLLRPFHYRTIGNLILGLSYVADHDDRLRASLQDPAAPDGLLATVAARPRVRVLSLVHEFPDVFARLVADPAGTEQSFTLTAAHLPLYLDKRGLTVRQAEIVPVVDSGPPGNLAFTLNNTPATGFGSPAAPRVPGWVYGGLPAVRVDAAFAAGMLATHKLKVTDASNLDKLHDLLIVVRYTSP
jgi:hypothetical protein